MTLTATHVFALATILVALMFTTIIVSALVFKLIGRNWWGLIVPAILWCFDIKYVLTLLLALLKNSASLSVFVYIILLMLFKLFLTTLIVKYCEETKYNVFISFLETLKRNWTRFLKWFFQY